MVPGLYEIYDARVPYRGCKDMRPVIAVEPPSGGKVAVALISGAMDLYSGPAVHFRLDAADPDFAATGLKKESYVAGDEIFTLSMDKSIRRRGKLQGDLRERFQDWI